MCVVALCLRSAQNTTHTHRHQTSKYLIGNANGIVNAAAAAGGVVVIVAQSQCTAHCTAAASCDCATHINQFLMCLTYISLRADERTSVKTRAGHIDITVAPCTLAVT